MTIALVGDMDLVKRSTLSVDAKEFYPANFNLAQNTSQGTTKSLQDRLNKYKNIEPQQNNKRELDYLFETIILLTNKPGKFDSTLPALVETLKPHFNDPEFITKITQEIFEQAINEPNFTYSGARLCAALDKECPLIQACLHHFCEKELENPANLSALTLFFAELYTQMNLELFGKCLLRALKQMLNEPTPDNVKYICQTLKLSGGKLDDLDKKQIDAIFDKLSTLCSSLPMSMKNLVQSVVTLRNKNWGKLDLTNSTPPAEPVEWSDGPVYYGPDGQELTLEESEFLSENYNEFILDDSDPDSLWNPEPEMSDEIQAAFAEFVRLSNR